MARQERNSVDYFPHTVSHGKKMFYLRSKYKNDGYAVWFMLLEQLGRAEYHYLDLSDEIQIMYLSSEFMVSEETLKDIINILVKFGDFDADLWNNHGIVFNEKFVESVSDAYKKRNNACISKSNLYKRLGFPYKDKSTPNELISNLEVPGSTQRKEEKRKEEKSKEEERDFLPSIDENLRTEIMTFFGFNEVANFDKYRDVSGFLKCLAINSREEYFREQFHSYTKYKTLNDSNPHGFKKFIGTASEKFEDGAWNAENWTHRLNLEKEKNSAKKEKGSFRDPPPSKFEKLQKSYNEAENPYL